MSPPYPIQKHRLNLQPHATLKMNKTIKPLLLNQNDYFFSFKIYSQGEFYILVFLNKPRKDSFLRYHGIPTKMTPRMPIYCWVRPRKLICFSPKSIQFHGLIRKKKNTVSFYLVSTTICSFGCDKLCFLFFLQTSFNCL